MHVQLNKKILYVKTGLIAMFKYFHLCLTALRFAQNTIHLFIDILFTLSAGPQTGRKFLFLRNCIQRYRSKADAKAYLGLPVPPFLPIQAYPLSPRPFFTVKWANTWVGEEGGGGRLHEPGTKIWLIGLLNSNFIACCFWIFADFQTLSLFR